MSFVGAPKRKSDRENELEQENKDLRAKLASITYQVEDYLKGASVHGEMNRMQATYETIGSDNAFRTKWKALKTTDPAFADQILKLYERLERGVFILEETREHIWWIISKVIDPSVDWVPFSRRFPWTKISTYEGERIQLPSA
jgi:hypothetical protein